MFNLNETEELFVKLLAYDYDEETGGFKIDLFKENGTQIRVTIENTEGEATEEVRRAPEGANEEEILDEVITMLKQNHLYLSRT